MRLSAPLLVASVLFFTVTPMFATNVNHAIGVSYSAGAQDVFDFYEDNFPVFIDFTFDVPVGLSYRAIFLFDRGLRADIGLGPIVYAFGDFEHIDFPVSGTVGWNFNDSGDVNPYARAGIVGHGFSSNATEDSTAFGGLGALGIEFNHQRNVNIFVEAGYDTSEVRFESFSRFVTEEIRPTGFTFTVGTVLAYGR